MSDVLVVTVPPVPRDCAQNSHVHWRTRATANKEARYQAQIAGRCESKRAQWRMAHRARISVVWYMARTEGAYHPLDAGNAWGALKATIDGLVDALIVASDSHRHLEIGEIRLLRAKSEHKGKAEIVLTIERFDNDHA